MTLKLHWGDFKNPETLRFVCEGHTEQEIATALTDCKRPSGQRPMDWMDQFNPAVQRTAISLAGQSLSYKPPNKELDSKFRNRMISYCSGRDNIQLRDILECIEFFGREKFFTMVQEMSTDKTNLLVLSLEDLAGINNLRSRFNKAMDTIEEKKRAKPKRHPAP